jgi:signal peptidase II
MQTTRGTPLTDGGQRRPPGPEPLHRRRLGVLVGVAVAAFAADVVSKVVVVATLQGRPPVHVVDDVLRLTLTRNSGAAFSIGTGATVVFTVVAVVVVVAIVRFARRLRSTGWAIALGLLLGGACGNLADRLFRAPGPGRGYVVDWIQLPHWPVFNVADACIVVGAVLAVLLALRGAGIDGARDGDENRGAPDREDHEPAARDGR